MYEKIDFQNQIQEANKVGWMCDIPTYEPEGDDEPRNLKRSVIEKDKYLWDQGEVRMFELFTEGIEDLYTKVIEPYVRRTPALYGKSLQWEMLLEKCWWLEKIDPSSFRLLKQMNREIFVRRSTTMSGFHQGCAFGPLTSELFIYVFVLFLQSHVFVSFTLRKWRSKGWSLGGNFPGWGRLAGWRDS